MNANQHPHWRAVAAPFGRTDLVRELGRSTLALGKLSLFGWHPFEGSQLQIYVGVVALAANLIVPILVTLIARRIKLYNGTDQTSPEDYHADEGSPKLREVAVH